MDRDHRRDRAAFVARIDVAPVGHACSTPKQRRVLRDRNVAEKASACMRKPTPSPMKVITFLAARTRPASATVAGLATLARDLALLGRIHRRKAPFRTARLGSHLLFLS